MHKKIVRELILGEHIRIDGRKTTDIRTITSEVGLLPRTHGSALFTRGETQALAVTTLGTSTDEQRIDSLQGDVTKRFMLHYNFPPFSTGEAKPLRGQSRREVGHGNLAERALLRVMPNEKEFPYVVRLVSEVLESNGSSSMATVCGGSLALMDAGVPIKAPVSGIAMGLIYEKGATEDRGAVAAILVLADRFANGGGFQRDHHGVGQVARVAGSSHGLGPGHRRHQQQPQRARLPGPDPRGTDHPCPEVHNPRPRLSPAASVGPGRSPTLSWINGRGAAAEGASRSA